MDLVKTATRKGRNVGYFNSYILQRIQRNKNFITCITGQTGSGKSYSALKEGELLDTDFTIDNVCFTPKEFMNLVNGKTKKLKRGSCIVFDEVQVSMSALDFQSLQARLINSCLQTFRYMGFILIMTSPFFSFINKSARKLFHSRIETVSIDPNKKLCTLKPFLLQTNQESGSTYRKYLRIWTKETGVVPYKRLKLGLPSEELRKAYEEKRQRFSNELNESISRDLDKMEARDKPKALTPKQKDIVLKLIDKKIVPQIAQETGVSEVMIYKQLELIQNKGVVITPIKEGSKVLYYTISGFDDN